MTYKMGKHSKFGKIGEAYPIENNVPGGYLAGFAFKEETARLFAASADLLAACENALEDGDDYHAIEVIKAAIAKAKGEACYTLNT
jgi:hypothetical protein